MKSIIILCLTGMLSFGASAQVSQQADDIADALRSVESKLRTRDKRAIQTSLNKIEAILSRYDIESSPRAICISNGEFGGFEKFAPYANGTRLGLWTKSDTCQALISTIKNDLICTSNGEFGGFEKFVPTEVKTGKTLGGYTKLDTCLEQLEYSDRYYICTSNGEFGGFEKFFLFDRQSKVNIGGSTSFSSCVRSIVN